MRSAQQFNRSVLLRAGTAYGTLAAAIPASFVLHDHLAPVVVLAAVVAAAVLVVLVLRIRDLGHRRGRLASWLLLTGPAAPLVLARRTRRWRPVLLVRPAGRGR